MCSVAMRGQVEFAEGRNPCRKTCIIMIYSQIICIALKNTAIFDPISGMFISLETGHLSNLRADKEFPHYLPLSPKCLSFITLYANREQQSDYYLRALTQFKINVTPD